MRRAILMGLAVATIATPAVAARKLPYWASLRVGEAMMRSGPGRQFPAQWLYKRAGLPVKVVKTYTVAHSEWRKISDPDGTEGWVQANLLSDARTALVVGDVRPLRQAAAPDAAIVWRAEPGVVGKVGQCANGWCHLDVRGRGGFVEVAHLYGVEATERLP